MATIRDTPGHVALDRIDVWFQDEARFGQQNTTTRLWAAKGSRQGAVDNSNLSMLISLVQCAQQRGVTEALVTPFVNQDAMRQHLTLISEATHSDRYELVTIDGAGWHTDFFDSLRIELTDDNVAVTVICPDFVVSQIHKRALDGTGKPLGKSPMQEAKILTAEQCAEMMLPVIATRGRLLIISLRGRLGRWLKLIAPRLIDKIARRAIASGH